MASMPMATTHAVVPNAKPGSITLAFAARLIAGDFRHVLNRAHGSAMVIDG